MKKLWFFVLLTPVFIFAQASPSCCPDATNEKQLLLWNRLAQVVTEADRELDGVLGVAILDLTNSQTLLHHADDVFPQASSIKIAVLAELYRQAGEGKLKLTDTYSVQQSDMVPDSDIFNSLTPGITRVTLRDLATMMVAVSDNSATNVLIERVGMENVNGMLDHLGLKNTRLRRKMMDIKAAAQGRENVSTPREMMTLLAAIYQGKLFSKELTADFFKVLSTHKQSPIRRAVPETVITADQPGELEGVRADSGIVFVQNRPFVICVMTTYLANEESGAAAIQKIATASYSYFDRLGRSSSYGRVVSPYNSRP